MFLRGYVNVNMVSVGELDVGLLVKNAFFSFSFLGWRGSDLVFRG